MSLRFRGSIRIPPGLNVGRRGASVSVAAAIMLLVCYLPIAQAVSTHPTITQRQDDAHQTTNNVTQEQPRGSPVIWERWTVVIGALQTIALVVTFCVMIVIGIRQLRAYVSITVNFMQSFDDKSRPYAGYEIKNSGTTPARNIYTNASIAAFEYPLPSGFRLPAINDLPQPKSSLFPGGILTGQVVANKPFTAAEITSIVNGSKRIYVHGVTRYCDMFGFKRTTHFGSSIAASATTLASLASKYGASDLSLIFEHVSEFNDVT